MVASAPTDFTEMVSMRMRLEEGFREGRLIKEAESTSGVKKFCSGFNKKKESEVSAVIRGSLKGRIEYRHQHVVAIAPIIKLTPVFQSQ